MDVLQGVPLKRGRLVLSRFSVRVYPPVPSPGPEGNGCLPARCQRSFSRMLPGGTSVLVSTVERDRLLRVTTIPRRSPGTAVSRICSTARFRSSRRPWHSKPRSFPWRRRAALECAPRPRADAAGGSRPAGARRFVASRNATRWDVASSQPNHMQLRSARVHHLRTQTPNKADISVDTVHTAFGRTNRAAPGRHDVSEKPLKKNFVPKSMSSCCARKPGPWTGVRHPRPSRHNRNEEPNKPSQQQAEDPSARDLNPPPHTTSQATAAARPQPHT
jgi:hypothetical protein